MRIVVKPNKKRIRENNNRKKLTEGTSNFWSMDKFPLLIFGYYPDVEEEVYRNAEKSLPDDFDGEISETEEYKNEWDKINYCVLDEEEVRELKSDLDDFNYKMYYDDRYDTYEDEEVKLEIKPGYYEANQIYVPDEKYLSDWQIDEINKFLKEIKNKYGLTALEVSYRFSNGETGYNIVKEDLSTDGDSKENGTKKYSEKKNPALKYNNQIKEDTEEKSSNENAKNCIADGEWSPTSSDSIKYILDMCKGHSFD